ncbi:MAG TPA: PepSY-associated TM helix domain-containing protein [Dokdonella sp.]
MREAVPTEQRPDRRLRAFWLKTLHQWHWISSALCLIGMLLFAATGITLNHAGQIESTPHVDTRKAEVPKDLLARALASPHAQRAPLPAALAGWLAERWSVQAGAREAEWSDDEIYLSLPRPGGDGWVSIDANSGVATYEVTDRGWLAYLNDLHKGREAGPLWGWFIDVFAVACLIFSLTGLCLLYLHARQRTATWPLVALGLVVPLLIAILFIHS